MTTTPDLIVMHKAPSGHRVPEHIEGPWDRAFDNGLGPAYISCSQPGLDYRCVRPCPGADGREDNL